MKRLAALLIGLGLALAPFQAFAAFYRPFEYSGWIPYWRSATGTAEFLAHMDVFTEINPFAYTVKSDGSLADQMDLQSELWPALVKLAHMKNIRVIPTVMWSDGSQIHRVLKNPELRANHILSIVSAVKTGGFDGIDIDYEDKDVETKEYYSLFLKELYKAMGNKWVQCTIEARTPLDSLRPGKTIKPEYANDYAVLNRYCDRVRIMAYDQASIDQKLTTSISTPYIPVADPRWVEKVLALAVKDISRKKLMLGVATYGYEYKVTPLSSGYAYDLQWAFNPRYATDLADSLGITPQRNVAGEISFSYRPGGNEAGAILDSSSNILWWSDASAIKDKIDLAKRYGIRGVSIFKIDGGSDPNIWNVLN
jgi:spore germination protein YaaH